MVRVDYSEELQRTSEASQEATEIAKAAKEVIVNSDQSYQEASECLVEIKGKAKSLEAQRKEITTPLLKAKRNVDDLFRPALNSLKAAETAIKKGLVEYQRKAQELQKKALESVREELEEGSEEGNGEKVRELLTKAQKDAPAVAGISIRTVTKYEITDESLLPREYMQPNTGTIRKAALAGKEIPGVRVWKEESIAASA